VIALGRHGLSCKLSAGRHSRHASANDINLRALRTAGIPSVMQDRFIFAPVAQETTGVWGQEGLKLIRKIGQLISEKTGETRSTSFLLQKMSITLQRGNLASVLGTLPAGNQLAEIFLL